MIRRIQPGLDAIPPVKRTQDNGTLEEIRRFRGLTLEQAAVYLERLGGHRSEYGMIRGDGWTATLSETRVPVGPSYRLTEVEITWSGESDVLERVIHRFRLKAFRAPG